MPTRTKHTVVEATPLMRIDKYERRGGRVTFVMTWRRGYQKQKMLSPGLKKLREAWTLLVLSADQVE